MPIRDGGTDAPVGLVIAGPAGADRRILAIAAAAEAVVSSVPA
ncbi:hypothetical protein [Chelatococcus asaccharovorans]|nr:hypothetical protein [Chelatococcus asaccharovorans]